ncbi:hypothetical protein Ddc_14529 [Ditylenchus destructor]|nr:hypothetical protein Ddc_14529 [Ditylenchus destructor]
MFQPSQPKVHSRIKDQTCPTAGQCSQSNAQTVQGSMIHRLGHPTCCLNLLANTTGNTSAGTWHWSRSSTVTRKVGNAGLLSGWRVHRFSSQ